MIGTNNIQKWFSNLLEITIIGLLRAISREDWEVPLLI